MGDAAEDEGTLSALERAVEREQPLHVVVTGGRHFVPRLDDATRLCAYLHRARPVVLHHGDCPHPKACDVPGCVSVDRWAAGLAERMDGVTVVAHPADWDAHGTRGGPIRNGEMLKAARDASRRVPTVVAYPGGRGTGDMVTKAQRAGCKVLRPHEEAR